MGEFDPLRSALHGGSAPRAGVTVAKATSKAEQAYAILKTGIMDGTYGPGYRLVIDQLSRDHGISSVPWRESLRRLEAEGWVDIVPNVGALVMTFDTDAWKHSIRILARLEGLATALSAKRFTAADLAAARALNRAMGDALSDFDTTRFGALNRQFHELLCSRSGDDRLYGMIRAEWTRMDIIRRSAFWYAPGRAVASITEHDALLDMIERGETEEAIETEARKHELRTLEAVLDHDAAQSAMLQETRSVGDG